MNNLDVTDIENFLYFRRVKKVLRIVDGDTVVLVCDKGKREWDEEVYRLYAINTPERRKATMEAYKAAKAYLSDIIKDGGQIYVNTLKDEDDAFGRWLAVLYNERGECLNRTMLDSGHAVLWKRNS
jgi:endonuclease YncB( thermonuclease family)